MPAPTIIKGEEHFFTNIYSGNGQGQRVGKFVPFTDNGTITNSCLFNRYDDPMLAFTPSGTGTNRRIYTMSVWFKPADGEQSDSNGRAIFFAGPYGNDDGIQLSTANNPTLRFWLNGASSAYLITNRTFEDSSKFYHLLVAVDTTQSTASNRVKIYIDGDQITSFSTETYPTQNYDGNWSTAVQHNVGAQTGNNRQFDGYLAEFNYVDGTALTPSTFGLTDTSTGRWIPKTLTGITYGTNGFRLKFQDSSALGDDTSGNGNDLSATNLAATDQRTDTPTNNIATMRPYNPSYSQILYEGNLTTYTNGNNKGYPMCSTLRPKGSGKYYAEVRTSGNGGGNTLGFGVFTVEDLPGVTASGNVYPGHSGANGCGSGLWYVHGGTNQLRYGTASSHVVTSNPSATINGGDVIGIALDLDNFKVSFYNNSGSLIGTTFFDASKAAAFMAMSNGSITFIWNFGDNGTFAGNETAGGNTDENGDGNFFHSVPSGFKMLKQDNLPETGKGIPAFSWIKNRDASDAHAFYDSSRGPQKEWENSESNEATVTDGLQKFLQGGFAIEDNDALNTTGESFVAWNWVGNSGTEVANTDGSGATVATTVQANDTAGFSICQFQGTGSTLKFAHGLSATPEWFITKRLDAGAGAATSVYHVSNGINEYLHLNESDAVVDSGAATSQFTGVSSTNITLGSNSNSNNNGSDVVAYVWRSVEGFSKFGSYTGTGNANGPFIYLGFKPAWILVKQNNSTGGWIICDNIRSPINPVNKLLSANITNSESTFTSLDILSNGFKQRNTDTGYNGNGSTYVYMAFAEHPFFGNGTNPATAR